jgi:hypothetical protein
MTKYKYILNSEIKKSNPGAHVFITYKASERGNTLETRQCILSVTLTGWPIDLVLIDQQSVGKRTHDLMDCQCEKEMDDHLPACQQIF